MEPPDDGYAPNLSHICSYQYEMSGFTAQCVDTYCELGKIKHSELPRVATPCIDETLLTETLATCLWKQIF